MPLTSIGREPSQFIRSLTLVNARRKFAKHYNPSRACI